MVENLKIDEYVRIRYSSFPLALQDRLIKGMERQIAESAADLQTAEYYALIIDVLKNGGSQPSALSLDGGHYTESTPVKDLPANQRIIFTRSFTGIGEERRALVTVDLKDPAGGIGKQIVLRDIQGLPETNTFEGTDIRIVYHGEAPVSTSIAA